jgi:hypothetical protein
MHISRSEWTVARPSVESVVLVVDNASSCELTNESASLHNTLPLRVRVGEQTHSNRCNVRKAQTKRLQTVLSFPFTYFHIPDRPSIPSF